MNYFQSELTAGDSDIDIFHKSLYCDYARHHPKTK